MIPIQFPVIELFSTLRKLRGPTLVSTTPWCCAIDQRSASRQRHTHTVSGRISTKREGERERERERERLGERALLGINVHGGGVQGVTR